MLAGADVEIKLNAQGMGDNQRKADEPEDTTRKPASSAARRKELRDHVAASLSSEAEGTWRGTLDDFIDIRLLS